MSSEESEQRASGPARLDPTLMAVLAHRFEAIVREMTNTLFRTGRSSILNMARDFSCSIVTADDQLFAAAEGLQVHVLGAGLQTSSMRELHPDLREGDAYLHNDPMLGNTHTADHTILVPVFVDGEHIFTASAKAHQADCGHAEPSTYVTYVEDVYAEGGLVFPCVKVQEDHRDIEDIIRMCRRRIRVPEVWYGDYLAAVGAARIGERRLKEVIARYGTDTIKDFVTAWLDYSERRMEQAIRSLPARRLQARSCHDPIPGLPDGIEVAVGIEVDPDAGRVTFDLRESLEGFCYTRLAATVSSAMRLMSIGQHEAHALLTEMLADAPSVVDTVLARRARPSQFAPVLDLAVMSQQYVHSRLFRS